jgi:serine/threonine protein kinase
MQFWNELEGRVFDGYPLRRLMRSEGRTAWFETDAGDGQRATISVTESLTDVDEVIERLEAAQRLQDPNLVVIFKVGRARFEKALFVYALMEFTEQNLHEVLEQQSLSKEDVQQVAEALVGALTTIHQHGLLHGHVEPASVLSVGETVKLRSDCLQTPGSTRAGDVAGIGATVFQAFTQRKAEKADDGQINRLPAPFAEIVRNSLSSRWSLAQVAAALRPPTAPAVGSAAAPPSRAVASATPTPAEPLAANPVPAVPASPKPAIAAQEAPRAVRPTPPRPAPPSPAPPPISSRPVSPRKREEDEEEDAAPRSSRTIAIYAALALVILLIAVWLFRPHSNSQSNSNTNSPAASSAVPSSAPSLPAAAPPQKPDANQPARPSAARSAPTHAAKPAEAAAGTIATGSRSIWRVVAFTYNREDQAKRKTEEIGQQHADLEPSVLSLPAGGHPRFLVTIGGAMSSRGQALALRDKAAALGLPADTYVENFSQ